MLVPFARLSERGEVGEVRGVGGVLEERSCSLVGVVNLVDSAEEVMHPSLTFGVHGVYV